MDPQTWEQAQRIFHQALDAEREAREAFVLKESRGDAALFDVVIRMLEAEDEHPDYLESFADWFSGSPSVMNRDIGPYQVMEQVEYGGVASMVLARRKDTRRLAAIKMFRNDSLSKDVIYQYVFEQRVLHRLQTKAVAAFYETGLANESTRYFAMEHVSGEPILAYCARKELSMDQCLALFEHAAKAIQALHNNLITHGSVSPQTILVTGTGTVKLIHSGVARLLIASGEMAPIADRSPVEWDLHNLGHLLAALADDRVGAASNELAVNSSSPAADLQRLVRRCQGRDHGSGYETIDELVEDIDTYRARHSM